MIIWEQPQPSIEDIKQEVERILALPMNIDIDKQLKEKQEKNPFRGFAN
jgi:hypothetical protein